MKIAFFSLVLVLVFCSAVVAQETKNESCPQIEVTGPSGVTAPGEKMIFSVNVLTDDFQNIKYNWTIDKGTIISGQGTPVIEVETIGYNDDIITAEVEVIGLAGNCPNKGEEKGHVREPVGTPVTITVYENIDFNEEKAHLRSIANFIKTAPDTMALFLVQYPKDSSLKKLKTRLKKISDYLAKELKIPQNRFSFVVGSESDSYQITVYAMPEGSWDFNWKEYLDKMILESQSPKKTPK